MSASLVGSEMCIRDRDSAARALLVGHVEHGDFIALACIAPCHFEHVLLPVSYTHLTLPTICSV
eukprot:6265095-Alexandrium_andersonii.AAC.1